MPQASIRIQERCDEIRPVGVLGSPSPTACWVFGPRRRSRQPSGSVGGNAGDLGGHVRRHRFDDSRTLSKSGIRAATNALSLESLPQDVVQHRVEQCHVRSRLHLQVDVARPASSVWRGSATMSVAAPFVGPLDGRREHRVRPGRVRAGDEDDVGGVLHLAHRPDGRRGVERALHAATDVEWHGACKWSMLLVPSVGAKLRIMR